MTFLSSPTFIAFILSNLLSISFGAGGMYFLIKQMRRQLNGVGQKAGRLQIIMLTFCKAEDREKIADLMLK